MLETQAREIAVEWIGEGKPLVVLHGWGKSKETLRPLAQLLSYNRRVGLVDLPGFGAEPPPTGAWGTEEYAEWLAPQLEGPCDLLGHSLGARIALRIAHKYPEKANRLILIGAAGLRNRSFKRRVRMHWIKSVRSGVRCVDKAFRSQIEEHWFRPRYGSADYKAAGVLRPTLVRVVNEDLAPILPHVGQRTLLLWGTRDPETPPDMGRRMARALPTSQLIWLEGKGHEPYDGVGSHLCAEMIDEFLCSST
jgi:pimeloyl-ACP methyl ester carboxylesterase